MVQLIKNLPAMWENWVGSLDWEDPLEKGKATHSSILPAFKVKPRNSYFSNWIKDTSINAVPKIIIKRN